MSFPHLLPFYILIHRYKSEINWNSDPIFHMFLISSATKCFELKNILLFYLLLWFILLFVVVIYSFICCCDLFFYLLLWFILLFVIVICSLLKLLQKFNNPLLSNLPRGVSLLTSHPVSCWFFVCFFVMCFISYFDLIWSMACITTH